jgi:hypothetical protein
MAVFFSPQHMQPKGESGPGRLVLALGVGLFLVLALTASAQSPTVRGKAWPPGYFLQDQALAPREHRRLLDELKLTLQQLNESGEALVVKGTLIEPWEPQKKLYSRATVLDESGLRVMVRNLPNLYYGFTGPRHLMNQNVYLLIKKVRLLEADSLQKGALLVEGDYQAYAAAYIQALQETMSRALQGENEDRLRR